MVRVSAPVRLIAATSALSVSVAPFARVTRYLVPFPPSACEARSIALMSALSWLALATLRKLGIAPSMVARQDCAWHGAYLRPYAFALFERIFYLSLY